MDGQAAPVVNLSVPRYPCRRGSVPPPRLAAHGSLRSRRRGRHHPLPERSQSGFVFPGRYGPYALCGLKLDETPILPARFGDNNSFIKRAREIAMRLSGLVLITVALRLHAAILAQGQWRVTVHSPYLDTTYTTCDRGVAASRWMVRETGQKCHVVFWRQTGQVIQGREVCYQAMPNGGVTATRTDIHLTLGPHHKSYAGHVSAHVRTPMGVFTSKESLVAHWLSPVCAPR